jgi:acylphosphatase
VSGRVQGVGFRWFVRNEARRLGIAGDVANLADGRVEIRAFANGTDLDRLLAAVRTGPPGSRVDQVRELEPPEEIGADGFEVRYPGGES